jgi:ABC-type sulfate transport system permease subunit
VALALAASPNAAQALKMTFIVVLMFLSFLMLLFPFRTLAEDDFPCGIHAATKSFPQLSRLLFIQLARILAHFTPPYLSHFGTS